MKTIKCHRCNGTGKTAFHHIADGVCFLCGGSGVLEYSPEKHDNLTMFIEQGKGNIESADRFTLKVGCDKVSKGLEYVCKKVGDYYIFWNKKAGANWHFRIPTDGITLIEKHFARI